MKTQLLEIVNKIKYKKIFYSICLLAILCLISMLPVCRKCIIMITELVLHRKIDNSYWMGFILTRQALFELLCLCIILGFLFPNITSQLLKEKYYLFFSVCIFAFFIISNIQIIKSNNFTGYNNTWNFYDFLLSIEGYGKVNNFYSTNYPPLCIYFFKFLLSFLPSTNNNYAINYLATLYNLFVTLSTFLLVFYLIKGSTKKKVICGCIIFLTGPFLFTYQRMNIIHLALIFTLFYYAFYNSKNKVLHELALISLAIAANIKIFPAIFGAILLKEKKWGASIRCAIYGVLLFLLPLFMEPLMHSIITVSSVGESTPINIVQSISPASSASENSPISMVQSMSSFSSSDAVMTSISIKAIVHRLLNKISTNQGLIQIIKSISPIICLIVTLFVFFFSKKKHNDLLLLSALCVLIPTSSAWYGLIFFTIPLIQIFNYNPSENANIFDKMNKLLFILLFSFCINYLTFLQPNSSWHIMLIWIFTIISAILSIFKEDKIEQYSN